MVGHGRSPFGQLPLQDGDLGLQFLNLFSVLFDHHLTRGTGLRVLVRKGITTRSKAATIGLEETGKQQNFFVRSCISSRSLGFSVMTSLAMVVISAAQSARSCWGHSRFQRPGLLQIRQVELAILSARVRLGGKPPPFPPFFHLILFLFLVLEEAKTHSGEHVHVAFPVTQQTIVQITRFLNRFDDLIFKLLYKNCIFISLVKHDLICMLFIKSLFGRSTQHRLLVINRVDIVSFPLLGASTMEILEELGSQESHSIPGGVWVKMPLLFTMMRFFSSPLVESA